MSSKSAADCCANCVAKVFVIRYSVRAAEVAYDHHGIAPPGLVLTSGYGSVRFVASSINDATKLRRADDVGGFGLADHGLVVS